MFVLFNERYKHWMLKGNLARTGDDNNKLVACLDHKSSDFWKEYLLYVYLFCFFNATSCCMLNSYVFLVLSFHLLPPVYFCVYRFLQGIRTDSVSFMDYHYSFSSSQSVLGWVLNMLLFL